MATTSTMVAQSSKTIIRKSDPAYSLPQNARDKQLIKDEKRRKGETVPTVERSKSHMTNPKEQNKVSEKDYQLQRSQDNKTMQELKIQKADRKATNEPKQYKRAYRLMEKALDRRENALRKYNKLLESQKKELSDFEGKYNKALASGSSSDEIKKLDAQRAKLQSTHASQLSQAQSEIDKASREYESAKAIYEDLRN